MSDLDALLISLYVLVDDLLPVRRRFGRPPRISDSELILSGDRAGAARLPERATLLAACQAAARAPVPLHPRPVLAALIIHAVSHLWKVKEFRRYHAERRIEFALGLATLFGVITIDVLPGLVIGVVSMLLLVVYNASRPHVAALARVPGTPGAYGDIARHPDYERIPGLLVLRLESPLFYANATLVRERVKYLVGSSDPLPKAVVLDAGANVDLDITSTEILEQLAAELRAAGIELVLADVRRPVIRRLQRAGLLEILGDKNGPHCGRGSRGHLPRKLDQGRPTPAL